MGASFSQPLAICTRQPGNELIAAECHNLTGGLPDGDGIASCTRIDLVPKAAYIQAGLMMFAMGSSLEALTATVAAVDPPSDDFRIELIRTEQSMQVQRQKAIVAIANTLKGYPNLDAPQHRFLLLIRPDRLEFGEILTTCAQDYDRHIRKPYHTSSSLPAQLARGMVNLVAPPAQSVIDPCCGTGSLLLEAQALGLQAAGCDRNPRMVGMTRKNLAYFGYQADIQHLDARQYQHTADAVVTDLPYGFMQAMDEDNVRGILHNCACLAPTGVFAAGIDITPWLEDAGYRTVEVFQVKKRNKFIRLIHRARTEIKED